MNSEAFAGMWVLLAVCALYITTSAGMIAFNKYLMHEGRFPYATTMVLIHSGFSAFCALMLFLIKPSLFPSLTDPDQKVSIDRSLILHGALPIAVLFSIQLVLSNTAYLHSSLAFLQMMKESNLVLVYVFSLIAALETFGWNKILLIAMIIFATMLTIHGELNFSWTGFCIQGSGQLFESAKIVMQAVLLSSAGHKLDVLTYVIVVMPLCFCVLGAILFALVYVHPLENLRTPEWKDIVAWWPVLLANATVAFALNLSIALFMKKSSAVGFILAGIAKDAAIVLSGVLALSESISLQQLFGFTLQLGLIWVWSLMKMFPNKFDDGILSGLMKLAFEPAVESKSLLNPSVAFDGDSESPEARYGTAGDQGKACRPD